MEHAFYPRLGEYMFGEEKLPRTMIEAVGTEADNPTLSREATGETKGAHKLTGSVSTMMRLTAERTSKHCQ